MPSYFVQQPDGRLAMFSTIVDGFTYVDMTDEEAVEVMVEHAVERARADAARGIAEARADDTLMGPWRAEDGPADGLRRWRRSRAIERRVRDEGGDG